MALNRKLADVEPGKQRLLLELNKNPCFAVKLDYA